MNTATWKSRLSAGWLRPVFCAVGAALFLLAAYILYFHRTDLWHLWLPTSANNDEVIYNRQLAGVLSDGQPEGVYGYNEGRAAVGHFGAWGPVLILLYAVPGLLVGTGVNMMFWCNMLFAVAGWTFFSQRGRLSWRRQLTFGMIILCACQPMQQVFSGTAEPLQYFLILCILGSSIVLQRGFSRRIFWALALACMLETVVRAYTVVLWLFPVVLLWKSHRRTSLLSGALAVLSLGGYFVITRFCNAPYFSGNDVDFRFFSLLGQGDPWGAVCYQVERIQRQLELLWTQYVSSSFTGNPTQQAISFWLLLLLIAVVVISLVVDVGAGHAIRIRVCALVCTVISQMVMLAFYEPDPLVRHYMMLFVLLLAAFVYESKGSIGVLLPILLLQMCLPADRWMQSLPTYDRAMDEQLQTLHSALQQDVENRPTNDTWDATLAYAWSTDLFHGYLYAVPAGMGIQFDSTAYLADLNNKINSRYVMTYHGSKVETRLLQQEWQELVSTKDVVIYVRSKGEAD